MSLLIKTAIKDIIFEPNIIGITNQDIFLAENINLINKTNDFYKMMDNEEDIINDYFNSLEELERLDNSNLLESECIYTDFIYQDIPVRIKTINLLVDNGVMDRNNAEEYIDSIGYVPF